VKYQLSVNGYDFTVTGTPHHALAWKLAGIDVAEIVNEIPAWVNEIGLTRLWCFFAR